MPCLGFWVSDAIIDSFSQKKKKTKNVPGAVREPSVALPRGMRIFPRALSQWTLFSKKVKISAFIGWVNGYPALHEIPYLSVLASRHLGP